MTQLESLMKMLKNQQTSSSPRSTPNSSPRSGKSPPIPPQPQTNSNHQSQGKTLSHLITIHYYLIFIKINVV